MDLDGAETLFSWLGRADVSFPPSNAPPLGSQDRAYDQPRHGITLFDHINNV